MVAGQLWLFLRLTLPPHPAFATLTRSRPLARPFQAFGSAELLLPFPKQLKSPHSDAEKGAERFGDEFFRTLPTEPGVYFLCGATEGVLYVGNARNLRKRLSSYRVANPAGDALN